MRCPYPNSYPIQPTKMANILDLLFTNNLNLSHNILYNPTLLSISHHKIIQVATTFKASPTTESCKDRPKYSNFDSLNFLSEDVDWEKIDSAFLNYNWQQEFRNGIYIYIPHFTSREAECWAQ